mgnify:CR=1 FL=1
MFLKRISFFLFIYSISISSQTLNDVLEFSIENPIGTARFESMGGAFGAFKMTAAPPVKDDNLKTPVT